MRENWGDKVVQGVQERLDKASEVLAKGLKNVKPFDKDPIDANEIYFHYRQLTSQDMEMLIQKHGHNVVNDFLCQMNKIEQDKRRNINA